MSFCLCYVGEYEKQMMRMIAKNERLIGRINECEKLLARREVMSMNESYANVVGKDMTRGVV